jgi:hypothetical protein
MTAQRIVIPSTAFSKVPSKQRKPRERNEQHLKFIRSLRCCICGAPNPDPAHIRAASPLHGKRETANLGEGFRQVVHATLPRSP